LGIEGFDFADGRELRLADTSEAFASAIIDLLGDPQESARLGAAARAAVEVRYGWERIVPRLERLYDA
jgi:glycosyltransferase involved in cell wall biosynthesis